MSVRENAVEDDRNVRAEFGYDIECTWNGSEWLYSIAEYRAYDLPQTVQRTNSISASGSLASLRLMAIADWPITIVPM